MPLHPAQTLEMLKNSTTSANHFDVLIVGAGLSGIGAAYHLQKKCPTKSYAILESRHSIGGTWDIFRYPGVRSDSDMHTLGYSFKPWREAKDIADGPSILKYVRETAAENGIEQKIRFGHKVKSAQWSSAEAAWKVETEVQESAEVVLWRCNFLLMCAGYYSYQGGYTPDFQGQERFTGRMVHPQQWPQDLDYRGKKVVVIGSGATAMTVVPAMSKEARLVTLLQRSPTYVVSRPDQEKLTHILRQVFPEKIAYALTRWKNVLRQQFYYNVARKDPQKFKHRLLSLVQAQLGEDYDVKTHFTPTYNPWDQRLCLIPNGDLFEAIRAGKVEMVTDHIETFTENGLLLQSGRSLEADIIVTATGLNLNLIGGAEIMVDGHRVEFPKTYTYKGMMYSQVPNLVTTFGYINASWTLRADLTAEYACRLINHLEKTGLRQCTPCLRKEDQEMPEHSWIAHFSSNYLQRASHLFPKQGDREPWINPQNYQHDKKMIRRGALEDGVMQFSNPLP